MLGLGLGLGLGPPRDVPDVVCDGLVQEPSVRVMSGLGLVVSEFGLGAKSWLVSQRTIARLLCSNG